MSSFLYRLPQLLLHLFVLVLFAPTAAWSQSIDDGFAPTLNPGGRVTALVARPDGRILVGGEFSSINGVARASIARLNADGSVDPGFDPGAGFDGRVADLVVQPDGRLLVAGAFGQFDGQAAPGIARLNPDGSLDPSFDAGPGANGDVLALTLDDLGRIYAGGVFTQFDGVPRSALVRLLPDGSPDASYVPAPIAATGVARLEILALDAEDRLLISGNFSSIGATSIAGLARLLPDGTPDSGFVTPITGALGAIEVQADGTILAAGSSTVLRLLDDGSADPGFDAGALGLAGLVDDLHVQADGRILLAGGFTASGGPDRLVRLNVDGSVDTDFSITGLPDDNVRAVVELPNGEIVAGGDFTAVDGVARAGLAAWSPFGALDENFDAGGGLTEAFLSRDLPLRPDGRVLVTGRYSEFDGMPVNLPIRLLAGGGLEPGFPSGAGIDGFLNGGEIDPVTLDNLIFGSFSTYDGTPAQWLARLGPAGLLDTDFAGRFSADREVEQLVVQRDRKLVLGGAFSTVNGQPRSRLARVHADGSLDTAFVPDPELSFAAGDFIAVLLVQADGKIVIGGQFTLAGSAASSYIVRLNADGSLDAGFDPGAGPNGSVSAIAQQPDGRLLIGGQFTTFDATPMNGIARLNTNGSLSFDFSNPDILGRVSAMALHADGRVLIGGFFNAIAGQPVQNLALLLPDGTADLSFDPAFVVNGGVTSLNTVLAARTWVGGGFTAVGGQPRGRLARFRLNQPATQRIEVDQSELRWVPRGAMPAVAQARFERSVDGVNFTPLGPATWTGSEWALSDASLPSGWVWIRVRAPHPPNADLVFTRRVYLQPALDIEPEVLDFGEQKINSSQGGRLSPRDARFTNTGTADLVITSIDPPTGAFSTPEGFALPDTPCPGLPITLAAGASCDFRVWFSPDHPGPAMQTLEIVSNAPESPDALTLTGFGTQPIPQFTPSPADFGDVLINTTSDPITVVVENIGDADLIIGNRDEDVEAPFTRTVTTCVAFDILDPGESCSMTFVFAPTGLGDFADTLVFDTFFEPFPIEVTGTGAAGELQIVPDVVDFGPQPIGVTSTPEFLTLSNVGPVELAVNFIEESGTVFTVADGSCPATSFVLNPGEACTVGFVHSPDQQGPSTFNGIVSNNGLLTVTPFTLTGSGGVALVDLAPSSLDFGDQVIGAGGAVLASDLTNTGDGPLEVTSIGPVAVPFNREAGSCGVAPFQLPPGASCRLNYRFDPTAAGPASAGVAIESNAAGSPDSLALSGNGIGPMLMVTPVRLAFGELPLGVPSAPAVVSIDSIGVTDLAIGALSVVGAQDGDYDIPAATDGCSGQSLPPGFFCTFDVVFTPTGTGVRRANVDIGSNALGPATFVELIGTNDVVFFSDFE